MKFEKYAGMAAMAAGVAVFLYSVAFVIISKNDPVLGGILAALFLMLTGMFGAVAWTGFYPKLKELEPEFARWVYLLAIFGLFGATIHGGYDLANALGGTAEVTNLPSQVDPRGLLTFGFTGLALLKASWLLGRSKKWPANFAYVGYLTGLLSLVLYLGRLIVVTADSPVIVGPALLNGFIVGPVWYLWLGKLLKKD